MMGSERVVEHLKEKLKDPAFREIYELDQQKLVIAKSIIDYRIKHSLTQGTFAEKMGVTQQHISKIESGEFSSIRTLEKILIPLGYAVQIRVVPFRAKTHAKAHRSARLKKRLQLT